jgi:hypothetical protein
MLTASSGSIAVSQFGEVALLQLLNVKRNESGRENRLIRSVSRWIIQEFELASIYP